MIGNQGELHLGLFPHVGKRTSGVEEVRRNAERERGREGLGEFELEAKAGRQFGQRTSLDDDDNEWLIDGLL